MLYNVLFPFAGYSAIYFFILLSKWDYLHSLFLILVCATIPLWIFCCKKLFIRMLCINVADMLLKVALNKQSTVPTAYELHFKLVDNYAKSEIPTTQTIWLAYAGRFRKSIIWDFVCLMEELSHPLWLPLWYQWKYWKVTESYQG